MFADLLVAPVRAAAERAPLAPAVVDQDRTTTYRSLVSRIDETAECLLRAGVRPGDTISLHAERHPSLPGAMLGAWTTGARVQLIDSTLPHRRVEQCEQAVAPQWRLRRDDLTRLGVPVDDNLPECSHVLMTSGSTGTPAAVAVSAAGLAGPLQWYASEFNPTPEDRVALLSGLGHDPLLRDILVPLHHGATLLVPPLGALGNPRALADFVGSSRISILHSTPALLELLLVGSPQRLPHLRLVVSSGASLPVALVRRLREVTDAVVVNAYGATETPQIASCSVVDAGAVPDSDLPGERTIGVGNGVAGADLLIVGDEVVVRSRHLALGYIGAHARSDRFIDDPLGEPGYRAYRTGDRAVSGGPSGLTITGRLDRQICVNGSRIAPEEVEVAALGHPGVRQAHAAPYDGLAGTMIGLSVVLDEPVEGEALRRFLRERLPAAAVPVRISILSSFGLDHNHKVVATPRVEVAE